MTNHRTPVFVLVLGCLTTGIGTWIFVREINEWDIVWLQTGFVYVTIGAMLEYEKANRELSARSSAFICSLPGIGTTLLLTVIHAPLNQLYPYWMFVFHVPVWLLPAFLVPWVYVLGKLEIVHQWILVGIFGFLISTPPAFLTTGTPIVSGNLRSIALIIAIGFWTAIPPYELGKRVSSTAQSRSIASPPAVLAVLTAAVLYSTIAYIQIDVFPPQDVGVLLLAIILYGPLLYILVRGVLAIARNGSSLGVRYDG